jgi:ribose-phosphate pyrophosphokinase
MSALRFFAGNSNLRLAQQVSSNLGLPVGKAMVDKFSDGEISVDLTENVRGDEVFILQSTSYPTNDNLMELLLMCDAFRRSSVSKINAVVPYFGYARQDRRIRSTRVAISAKVVADMLASVGVDRLITVDLHSEQIQGFFRIPVDNIYASPILVTDILTQKYSDNVVVVSPDIGGVVRARAIAKQIHDADLAIIDKRRPGKNQAQVMHIIGDVAGKDCVLVDDIVDTAGTLCKAADALKEVGAKSVVAYVSHPVLSGNAIENIENSSLDKLVVTDTISLATNASNCSKIEQLSISQLLAESIKRVYARQSISELFK